MPSNTPKFGPGEKTSGIGPASYRVLLDFLPDPVFVLDMQYRLTYVNPAFVKTFGWQFEEIAGRQIPFIPENLKAETRAGSRRLLREKVIHGIHTQRLTKEGRLLDVVLDCALFYEEADQTPSGQVVILRDVTRERRTARSNQALFRIAMALPRYRRLDELLEFIIKEVQDLIGARGASVILLDERRREFFIRVASFDDRAAGKKMREIRFPADQGVAGQVLKTGKPLIVPDTSQSPYFFRQVDRQVGYRTLNMLDVPIQTQSRTIGVLCAVNKKQGAFDDADMQLLATVGSMVALPLENARINDALKRSYEELKSVNRAKGRVIHHLSHELKTPVAVLAASLNLLARKLPASGIRGWQRTIERSQRNLKRLLDMQYEIEDILHQRRFETYRMLSVLLDSCSDVIEALAAEQLQSEDATAAIRRRIDELFGPTEAVCHDIRLARFTRRRIDGLRPYFAHRRLSLKVETTSDAVVRIPEDVLAKVIDGLVRNAVENTPDGARIEVRVQDRRNGPLLEVRDCGVGIQKEDRRLIFENYFPSQDLSQYATRKPYDFNAGGKGFDLLRMKIFSERYHFTIDLRSRRCKFLRVADDRCPGDTAACRHLKEPGDCLETGGTSVQVQFRSAASTDSRLREVCTLEESL